MSLSIMYGTREGWGKMGVCGKIIFGIVTHAAVEHTFVQYTHYSEY